MSTSSPVQPQHLSRKAVVYIRQSTTQQILSNTESLQLQRAMVKRAQELGWSAPRIEIVESDTGSSAQSTTIREGFKQLLSEVALGQVGLIVSYESTRLSRNCSDWYPLLDLCALKDCLIADRDGVYDPASVNGRMLLGMKGIVSEIELHTLRGRLTAGLRRKAERGELSTLLPVGLERQEDGAIVLDPDRQVQQTIALVFQLFFELGSASRVVHTLQARHVLLPRRVHNAEIVWRPADLQFVVNLLRNPAYAGAYVFGRTQTLAPHKAGVRPQQRERPLEQWAVVLHDHHPAYIDWESYLQNRRRLNDNYAEYQRRMSRGSPREGQALLVGLAYCGGCGHKLMVQYRAQPAYGCRTEGTRTKGCSCRYLPAARIDRAVREAFFEALQPAELDLYEQTVTRHQEMQVSVRVAQQSELQRLRYQVDLARRRYEQVDPTNRLVAAELERRWEQALLALEEAETQRQTESHPSSSVVPEAIPAEWREMLRAVGERLPALWDTPLFRDDQRKALLRCLIDKVVLARPEGQRDRAEVRIVWRGGAVSELLVRLTVGRQQDLAGYEELVGALLELEEQGLPDVQIAEELTARGYRSAQTDHMPVSTVTSLRREQGRWRQAGGRSPRVEGFWTLRQLAQRLDVPVGWLHRRIRTGQIDVQLDAERGVYLFPACTDTVDKLQRLRARQLEQVQF